MSVPYHFYSRGFLYRSNLVLYIILQILSCHGDSDRVYPFMEAKQIYDTRFKVTWSIYTTQNNDVQYMYLKCKDRGWQIVRLFLIYL